MGKIDKRVDEYISKKDEFAQPVLNHIRKLVHDNVPNVEETIKWGFPHFEYKGIICSMAAFKEHCAFTLWLGSQMKDPSGIMKSVGETAMGQFGRIKSLDDLPDDKIIISFLKQGIELNEKGVKLSVKKKSEKKELEIPEYFIKAISANKNALTTFEGFSYTNQKEYVEWVTEAKTETTREKRLATSVEWMAEGKIRNWKYVNC